MIRLGKQVQLLEWGEGTTTLNQNWRPLGVGVLRAKPKIKMGATLVTVEVDGAVKKENSKDDSIKVMQKGEGMTPGSDVWGEVAMGRLKSLEMQNGKTIVEIEIKTAMKVGGTGPG